MGGGSNFFLGGVGPAPPISGDFFWPRPRDITEVVDRPPAPVCWRGGAGVAPHPDDVTDDVTVLRLLDAAAVVVAGVAVGDDDHHPLGPRPRPHLGGEDGFPGVGGGGGEGNGAAVGQLWGSYGAAVGQGRGGRCSRDVGDGGEGVGEAAELLQAGEELAGPGPGRVIGQRELELHPRRELHRPELPHGTVTAGPTAPRDPHRPPQTPQTP